MPSVALQLLDTLRSAGIDTLFGIPGGASSPLFVALTERPEMRFVTARHETGAAFMAMGYAIATGRPGVLTTTAGPGITNALTGLASAQYEGIPLVHIAGEVSRSAFGRNAIQEGSASEFNAVDLTRRFTKYSVLVDRAEGATMLLGRGLASACSGRKGQVFLSLPLDIAAAEGCRLATAGSVRIAFDIDRTACAAAARSLLEAERPLILAGAGCREKASQAALLRLAERVRSPVAVTPKGKGTFPEDHDQYLGLSGFGGHESVVDYLKDGVDVILVAGSRLNDFATNAWSPLFKATQSFIQIDVDAGQFGKSFPVDLGLLGPVDAVVDAMLEGLPNEATPRSRRWNALAYQPVPRSPSGALTTAEVVLAMNEACPRDALFTADMGEHLSIALHFLRIRPPARFVTCLGFGSMGSSIGVAIGHQLGDRTRRAYTLCGDGGFLMYGAELATAVKLGLHVTFVVINDGRLNMCHHGMMDLVGKTIDFSTAPIDFAALAAAMGATGRIARTHREIVDALEERVDGPVLIDVRIDPDARLTGSQRNAALRHFENG